MKSGHLLCLDKHTTGDGIISALQVLDLLNSTRGWAALSEASKDVVMYPQIPINVPVPKGLTTVSRCRFRLRWLKLNVN